MANNLQNQNNIFSWNRIIMNPFLILLLQIIVGFFVVITFFSFFGLDTLGPAGPFKISLSIETLLIILGFIASIINFKKPRDTISNLNYFSCYVLLIMFLMPFIILSILYLK